jgi:hypothetical protein
VTHKSRARFWSVVTMVYVLVIFAFALTMYLVIFKEIDGEALGLVIGVWLREGMGMVFNMLNRETRTKDEGEE